VRPWPATSARPVRRQPETRVPSPEPRVASALAQAYSERTWGEDESWCGAYACSGDEVELPAGGDGR
jgi:hypothetical protein